MKSRLDFGQHLVGLNLTGEGVEVGTLFGEYAECILATWPGILNVVDPWIQQPSKIYKDGCNAVDFEEAFERTKLRLKQYEHRTRFWKMFSLDAVAHFKSESLDFVYLDGNHSLKSVREDIRAWWPIVRSKGILCGHDFYDKHSDYHECGVKTAVEEFAAENNLKLTLTDCTSWWITKP